MLLLSEFYILDDAEYGSSSLFRNGGYYIPTHKCSYPKRRKPLPSNLTYVCPCIVYENDERYQLDATIYLLL